MLLRKRREYMPPKMLSLLSTYSQALIGTRTSTSLVFSSPSHNTLGRTLLSSSKKTCTHRILSTKCLIPTRGEVSSELFSRSGLRQERMPKHVALTLDGFRRWSRANNNGQLTYEPFGRKLLLLADLCIKWGIPIATAFVFATCNLKRTHEANNLIFRQLQSSLEDNLEKFTRNGIRVSIIGQKWRLPETFQDTIKRVEEITKNGTILDFRYAIPYGGRWDIVEAARNISNKVKDGEITPKDIDEAMVERQLSTGIVSIPNPDLIIRYGGKCRLSNFYLWQAAHAELYFTDILGPEFEESNFIEALHWFQQYKRRFCE